MVCINEMSNITLKFESVLLDASSGLELAASFFSFTCSHMNMYFYNVSDSLIKTCSRKFRWFLEAPMLIDKYHYILLPLLLGSISHF